jgi:hypothetical protein
VGGKPHEIIHIFMKNEEMRNVLSETREFTGCNRQMLI